MPRTGFPRTFCLSVLCGVFALTLAAHEPEAQPGQRYGDNGRSDHTQQHNKNNKGKKQQGSGEQRLSAQEAAARAQARHGGRVLKVSPSGSGYRVRLLQDDGRVITVTIRD